jgi:predicted double-glycine peptidase
MLVNSSQTTQANSTAAILNSRERALTDFKEYLLCQGRTNGCGTTSLAMLMNYLSPRKFFNRETIDSVIRPNDMPTMPSEILKYLRQNGFRANSYNNSSEELLQGYLKQGIPVQVLINPIGSDELHYVNVVEYSAERGYTIADPASGKSHTYPKDLFLRKWNSPTLYGAPTGLNRFMIAALPPLSSGLKFRGTDGVLRNSSELELIDPLPSQQDLGFISSLTERVVGAFNFLYA